MGEVFKPGQSEREKIEKLAKELQISEIESDEEGEKETEEVPVLEALKYVEENGDREPEGPDERENLEEPKLDDFLENYM